MGEEEYRDNIQASTVTAKLPDINTAKGKQIAKNMARRIADGQMDIKSVPRSYQQYVYGELKGAMPTSEAINKAGKPVAIGFGAAMAAPWLIGAAAPFVANTAVGVVSPGGRTAAKLAVDLLGFELVDRFPTLFGQKRFTAQAGDLSERGFRAVMPDGKAEDTIAPYVRAAGEIGSGFAIGKGGSILNDALYRGLSRITEDFSGLWRLIRTKPVQKATAERRQAFNDMVQAQQKEGVATTQYNNEIYGDTGQRQKMVSMDISAQEATLDNLPLNYRQAFFQNGNNSLDQSVIGRQILDYVDEAAKKAGIQFDKTKIKDVRAVRSVIQDLQGLGAISERDYSTMKLLLGYGEGGYPDDAYGKVISTVTGKGRQFAEPLIFDDPITLNTFEGEAKGFTKGMDSGYNVRGELEVRPVADGTEFYVSPTTGEVEYPAVRVVTNQAVGIAPQRETVRRITTSGPGPEIQRGVKTYLDKIRAMIGHDGAVAGSGVLVENGYIAGVPGDVDFVTTEGRLKSLKAKLGANKLRNLEGVPGEKVSSKAALGGEADISIIGEDILTGNAMGKEALEFYSIIDPKGYNALMKQSAKTGVAIERMEIPMTPEEILDKIISDPSIMRMKTIVDAFGSYKTKHFPRVANMLFTLGDSEFNQAMELMIKRYLPNFKSAVELYPNLVFTNEAANFNYLKSLGFMDEFAGQYAKDPEKIRRLVELQSAQKSISTRSVMRDILQDGASIEDAILTNHATDVSATAGSMGGGNTMSLQGLGAGKFGWGSTRGVIQSKQTFHPESVTTPEQLQAIYERQAGPEARSLARQYGERWAELKKGLSTNQELQDYAQQIAEDYDFPVMRSKAQAGVNDGGVYVGRYSTGAEDYGIMESSETGFETGAAIRYIEEPASSLMSGTHYIKYGGDPAKLKSSIEKYIQSSISDLPAGPRQEIETMIQQTTNLGTVLNDMSKTRITSMTEFDSVVSKVRKLCSAAKEPVLINGAPLEQYIAEVRGVVEDTLQSIDKMKSITSGHNPSDFFNETRYKELQMIEKEARDKLSKLRQELTSLQARTAEAKAKYLQAKTVSKQAITKYSEAAATEVAAKMTSQSLISNVKRDLAVAAVLSLLVAIPTMIHKYAMPKDSDSSSTAKVDGKKLLNGGLLTHISKGMRPKFNDGGNVYTVKSGDNLSKIAKANGLSLKELLDLNPEYKADPNKIYVGQKVVVSYPDSEPTLQNLRTRRLQEAELNADNLSAILGARHDNTFAVIDKDKQVLTIYNKNGRIITSVPVNTGKSNDDYNTKTYLDEKGHLINMAGNNSTPAGITEITSIYDYQGAPSFQRARVGSDNKIKTVKDKKGRTVPDEVASSIHFERGVGSANSSNGCVRVTPEGAKILKNYLGVGSRIYTLPQHKESSRFVLNDGKLSYVADNVYGKQKGEEGNTTTVRGRVVDKHDWDDYNTTIDRTYSPLQIDVRDTDNKEYNTNKRTFAKSLEDNKEFVQKQLGLSSSEYNTLAMVAMGIADQESKFGTATSYKLKQNSAGVISALKRLKGEKTAQSQGVGQIKYGDDSAEAIAIYDKLGVTDNHNDIANEAKAIIGRLYHIYRNQYQNAKSWYTKAGLSTEQALAYIYNGGNFNEIKQIVNDGIQLSDKRISMSSSPLMRLLGIKDAKVSRQNYADNVVAKIDSSDYIGYVKQGGLLRFCATGGTIQKYDGGGPTKKKLGTRTTVISNRAESSNARTHRLGSKFFTANYSDLPVEGKRIINELCKELNIPADRVEESYNSGRLDKVIAARYKVENPEEARVRENDSPTKKTSEEYEARMNKSVYHGANYVAPNMPYAIPYLTEKEIKVPGVGRVSTNALDSLAKYAAITETPLSDALGLAAQETAFGALPLMNYTDDDSVDNRALGNSSYFRNYGEIPAENFVRDFRYNSNKPGDKPIDRSVPPLQHAFEYFKKGNYNRGDKNHTSDVKAKGREVMKTKAIQDWIANSEFAQKALRRAKRSQGGLLKYVSK